MNRFTSRLCASLCLVGWLSASALAGGSFVIPEGLNEAQRARLERFKTFQIKGVCNDYDMDRLVTFGVNTVRGYTIPGGETTKAQLDHAHRIGMKVILGEWMPHHGKNKGNNGTVWTFDYNAKEEEMLSKFIAKVEAIGDHPAILMWSLGNEVHLDEPYLRVVNRMSKAIHDRYPHHVTSLTMINAKPEAIEAVKKYAPDIDVLGLQSYSRGAVRGSMKNAEALWGKPFYMSEFNTNGPWNLGKAPWGTAVEEPVSNKVRDLKDCYKAIDESPLSLGSTIFVWGYYPQGYFSTLIEPDLRKLTPRGESLAHTYLTPQAEVMIEHFTGKPITGNRAPVITQVAFPDPADPAKLTPHRLAKPGEQLPVKVSADDPNGDPVEYVVWIVDSTKPLRPVVAGPYNYTSADAVVVTAPEKFGEYFGLIVARDNKGGGSISNVVFKVPDPTAADPYAPLVPPTK